MGIYFVKNVNQSLSEPMWRLNVMKTKLKFIVQKFLNDESQSKLIDTIKERGYDLVEASIIDSVGITDGVMDKVPAGDFIIPFGSIGFVRNCKEWKGGYCKSWNNIEAFKCTSYCPSVQHLLFNDIHAYFTVGSLRSLKHEIYRWFSKDCHIFIRPDSGEKPFTAGLFDLQYFDRDYKEWITAKMEPSDLVMVSTPKNILGEYRMVCDKDKNIITGSTYKFQDNLISIPSLPKGVKEKTQEVLESLRMLNDIFTVDICQDNDGNFWLLEINSFNAAGFYACDTVKIVEWLENKYG